MSYESMTEPAARNALPEQWFSISPSNGEMIIITRGENGYITFDSNASSQELRLMVDLFNEILGVSPEQEKAMLVGGWFGWDSPAAKLWSYDQTANHGK